MSIEALHGVVEGIFGAQAATHDAPSRKELLRIFRQSARAIVEGGLTSDGSHILEPGQTAILIMLFRGIHARDEMLFDRATAAAIAPTLLAALVSPAIQATTPPGLEPANFCSSTLDLILGLVRSAFPTESEGLLGALFDDAVHVLKAAAGAYYVASITAKRPPPDEPFAGFDRFLGHLHAAAGLGDQPPPSHPLTTVISLQKNPAHALAAISGAAQTLGRISETPEARPLAQRKESRAVFECFEVVTAALSRAFSTEDLMPPHDDASPAIKAFLDVLPRILRISYACVPHGGFQVSMLDWVIGLCERSFSRPTATPPHLEAAAMQESLANALVTLVPERARSRADVNCALHWIEHADFQDLGPPTWFAALTTRTLGRAMQLAWAWVSNPFPPPDHDVADVENPIIYLLDVVKAVDYGIAAAAVSGAMEDREAAAQIICSALSIGSRSPDLAGCRHALQETSQWADDLAPRLHDPRVVWRACHWPHHLIVGAEEAAASFCTFIEEEIRRAANNDASPRLWVAVKTVTEALIAEKGENRPAWQNRIVAAGPHLLLWHPCNLYASRVQDATTTTQDQGFRDILSIAVYLLTRVLSSDAHEDLRVVLVPSNLRHVLTTLSNASALDATTSHDALVLGNHLNEIGRPGSKHVSSEAYDAALESSDPAVRSAALDSAIHFLASVGPDIQGRALVRLQSLIQGAAAATDESWAVKLAIASLARDMACLASGARKVKAPFSPVPPAMPTFELRQRDAGGRSFGPACPKCYPAPPAMQLSVTAPALGQLRAFCEAAINPGSPGSNLVECLFKGLIFGGDAEPHRNQALAYYVDIKCHQLDCRCNAAEPPSTGDALIDALNNLYDLVNYDPSPQAALLASKAIAKLACHNRRNPTALCAMRNETITKALARAWETRPFRSEMSPAKLLRLSGSIAQAIRPTQCLVAINQLAVYAAGDGVVEPKLRSLAHRMLQLAARANAISVGELCAPIKDKLVWKSLRARHEEGGGHRGPCLRSLSDIYASPIETLVNESLEYVLPKATLSEDPPVESLIRDILGLLTVEEADLLTPFMEATLVTIMTRSAEPEKLNRALIYILGVFPGLRPTEMLLRWHSGILLHVVLLMGDDRLGRGRQKAMVALSCIIKMLDMDCSPTEHLRDHFLEITNRLVHARLLAPSMRTRDKEAAILGFEALIRMMAPYYAAFHRNIFAVLKLITSLGPDLRRPAIAAWGSFLHLLAPKLLGPLLGQVVVHLLGHLHQMDDALIAIFKDLFVTRFDSLYSWFGGVPLIPDTPELAEIRVAFDRGLALSIEPRGVGPEIAAADTPPTIATNPHLIHLCALLDNEHARIRELAAEELSHFLDKHRADFHAATLRGQLQPRLSSLFTSLAKGCRHASADVRVKFARAIGQLGAMGAEHLNLVVRRNVTVLNIRRQALAKALVEKHLIRLYRSPTSVEEQECIAYTIQELFKVDDGTDSAMASSVWDVLDEESRVFGMTFRNSKYEIVMGPAATAPTGQAIYHHQLSHRTWLKRWVSRLLAMSRDPFYIACIAAASAEQDVCSFLLPHLVLSLLLESETDRGDAAAAPEAILLEIKSILLAGSEPPPNTLILQAIFGLLDALKRFVNDVSANGAPAVRWLLGAIPERALADAAFSCSAYARCLFHLESEIWSQWRTASIALGGMVVPPLLCDRDHILRLRRGFEAIQDPDAFLGLVSICPSFGDTLEDMIVDCQAHQDHSQALLLLGKARHAAESPEARRRFESMELKCLRDMGLFPLLAERAREWIAKEPQDQYVRSHVAAYGLLASWHLNDWEAAEDLVRKSGGAWSGVGDLASFDAAIGGTLLSMRRGDRTAFDREVFDLRSKLAVPLAAASMESFQRCYPIVVRLHMLDELEGRWGSQHEVRDRQDLWDARLKLLQPSLETWEPVLSLRIAALDLARDSGPAISEAWLDLAKMARRAGRSQFAHYSVLQARDALPVARTIEWSKSLWASGKRSMAIAQLQRIVQGDLDSQNKAPHNPASPHLASAFLYCARWMSMMQYAPSVVSRVYESMIRRAPTAKAFYHHGAYLDDLSAAEGPGPSAPPTSLAFASYARSLELDPLWSCHETLPRMMTLWLNLGDAMQDATPCPESVASAFDAVQTSVERVLASIPGSTWFVVIRVLIAATTHHQLALARLATRVLFHAMCQQPERAMWHVVPMKFDASAGRSAKYQDLVRKALCSLPASARWNGEETFNYFFAAEKVVHGLLRACGGEEAVASTGAPCRDLAAAALPRAKRPQLAAAAAPTGEFALASACPTLAAAAAAALADVLVPIERQLGVARVGDPPPVTVVGFGDRVTVLRSKQRPKKIVFRGSDGGEYAFLAKSGDDLRRDAAIMTFSHAVNRRLGRDGEARQRRLRVRTYAVIPLQDARGIMSWVQHTVCLKRVVAAAMDSRGLNLDAAISQVLREHYRDDERLGAAVRRPLGAAAAANRRGGGPALVAWRDRFVRQILPKFPPVLHEWFAAAFDEPSAWLAARTNYARTAAVMSMAGAVLGLGDRHLENILVDTTTGDLVHVDLNCIFYAGTELAIPEVVPFRLTHNMVYGFGITGVEGGFRTCAERTLEAMRAGQRGLLATFEALVREPLQARAKPRQDMSHVVRAVADRIGGAGGRPYLGDPSLVQLSVQGHVDALIRDATNVDRLALMYVGWCPFV